MHFFEIVLIAEVSFSEQVLDDLLRGNYLIVVVVAVSENFN